MNVLLIGDSGAGKTLFVQRYLLGNNNESIVPTNLCAFHTVALGVTSICVCDTSGSEEGQMYWWLSTLQMEFHCVVIFIQEDMMFDQTDERDVYWRNVARQVTDTDNVTTFVTITRNRKCPPDQINLCTKEGADVVVNYLQKCSQNVCKNVIVPPLILSKELVWENRNEFIQTIELACCKRLNFCKKIECWYQYEEEVEKLKIPKDRAIETLKSLFSQENHNLKPIFYSLNRFAAPKLFPFHAADVKFCFPEYFSTVQQGMIMFYLNFLLRNLNVKRIYSWVRGHAFQYHNDETIYIIEFCDSNLYILGQHPTSNKSSMNVVINNFYNRITSFTHKIPCSLLFLEEVI